MKPMATLFLATALTSAAVMAQPTYVGKANTLPNVATFASGGISGTYWTAERIKAAKPYPLPIASDGALVHGSDAQISASQGPSQSAPGSGPKVNVRPNTAPLFQIDATAGAAAQQALEGIAGGVQPFDVGTGNHYTTSDADAGYSSLEKSYAWRTVGKLYFTGTDGLGYQCTASVIHRRIIVTAGHCVHDGNNSPFGWHSNFLFIPAFDGTLSGTASAPYQSWDWDYVTTTATWYSGGGVVPNAADYAMLQLRDRSLTTGGTVYRVGTVTGWLGWRTLALASNHTTKLGYPCNFTDCLKMIQTTSDNYRGTSPNNVEYGNDQRGGSSGGPWVQNFNAVCPAEGCGNNSGRNQVVGVTSYGYTSTGPRAQGASIPDTRWVNLWNSICARTAGNCS